MLKAKVESKIVKGSTVVLNTDVVQYGSPHLNGDGKTGMSALKHGVIYKVDDIEIVPLRVLTTKHPVDADGECPETNHDLMGSDRTVVINGVSFSAVFFRHATAAEVNQKARQAL